MNFAYRIRIPSPCCEKVRTVKVRLVELLKSMFINSAMKICNLYYQLSIIDKSLIKFFVQYTVQV